MVREDRQTSTKREEADMPAVPSEHILDAFRWRYATKKFDPRLVIREEDWAVLQEVAILSPSSIGLQPYRFIVVTSPELKARLRPACNGQAQVTDCSHFVVFTSRTSLDESVAGRHVELVARTRGQSEESLGGLFRMITGFVQEPKGSDIAPWAAKQAYLAVGFLLASAALMRIDACPIEGFDANRVDEVLGLGGTGYAATVCCALGYRSPDDKYAGLAKVRYPASDLVDRR